MKQSNDPGWYTPPQRTDLKFSWNVQEAPSSGNNQYFYPLSLEPTKNVLDLNHRLFDI